MLDEPSQPRQGEFGGQQEGFKEERLLCYALKDDLKDILRPRTQRSKGIMPAWQMSNTQTALFYSLTTADITNRSWHFFFFFLLNIVGVSGSFKTHFPCYPVAISLSWQKSAYFLFLELSQECSDLPVGKTQGNKIQKVPGYIGLNRALNGK